MLLIGWMQERRHVSQTTSDLTSSFEVTVVLLVLQEHHKPKLSAHIHLGKRHAATRPTQTEGLAGGADSFREVSRSKLAWPGKTLIFILENISTDYATWLSLKLFPFFYDIYSRHRSFRFHGSMLLDMAGVLTRMPPFSGAGPCTLVRAHVWLLIFNLLFEITYPFLYSGSSKNMINNIQ